MERTEHRSQHDDASPLGISGSRLAMPTTRIAPVFETFVYGDTDTGVATATPRVVAVVEHALVIIVVHGGIVLADPIQLHHRRSVSVRIRPAIAAAGAT